LHEHGAGVAQAHRGERQRELRRLDGSGKKVVFSVE
jgi:hypothetical protein